MKRLDQRKKRILFACILCMLAALYLIFLSHAGDYREKQMVISNPNLQIGTIVARENDVRRRKTNLPLWNQAERREKISVGDSLFVSNQSHATLQFPQGSSLTFGENSFARFQQVENEKLPSLICGNFLLHVEHGQQLKAGGTVTSFEGESGDVQVFVTLNQVPQFKVLSGQIHIKSKKELEKSLPPDSEDLALCPGSGAQDYVWRLYELYELKDGNISARTPQPDFVFANHSVSWPQVQGKKMTLQLASSPDFRSRLEFQTIAGNFTFPKLHAGVNYWRVSDDNIHWSAIQKISVRPRLLENSAPQLENPIVQIPLFQEITTIEMKMKAPIPVVGFVAEASLTENFTADTTRLFWSPQEDMRLSFSKPGSYFYRFRSVSAQQELSDWSATQRFDVFTPKLAAAPRMKRARKQIVAKTATLPEKRQPAAAEPQTSAPALPSTTSTLKYEEPEVPLRRNEKYHDTKISVQGFVWTMQSSQQFQQSTTNPVSSGLGLNYLSWWDHQGVEATLKTGLVAMNSAGSSALKDFEARYHYRFITGFPFHLLREFQTSFFLGYEVYRNSGGAFSSAYNLLKFGTTLEFPLASNWSTGGEFIYGLGSDSSNKKEISGHVSYFFTRAWSLGAGYRIHLFEAGSVAAAPTTTLPYREGYTEGYSILDYHF